MSDNSTIFLTGAAGFIGYHLAERFMEVGYNVVGVDSLNEYYSKDLKLARLERLKANRQFLFHHLDITDKSALEEVFSAHAFKYVVHMAAQAGVRYSLEQPQSYIDSNLVGFFNMMELCRHHQPEHFLFASSSSVYGLNKKLPFSEGDHVDHPASLYAATKRSNELMAHSYSHLFGVPSTGVRFFTVYGPWGRPDMALFKFTKAILEGKPIEVYNNGEMYRDFTFISDIVEGVFRLTFTPPAVSSFSDSTGEPVSSPFAVFNIGNGNPVPLLKFIETLEKHLEQKAEKIFLPMQPGDIKGTFADISALSTSTGYKPLVDVDTGVGRFVQWYRSFYC